MSRRQPRRSIWPPFLYALQGIRTSVREEAHMRFHLFAAALVIVMALLLDIDKNGWLWLIASIVGVLTSEMFNSAIERAVDLATAERHPVAKAAKDIAAGAVLVASLGAAAIGLIVLGPPLWHWLAQR
ncbi:diacylglycerol kinase family protein [Cohnella faecalis]|nr:diacylglycerol kinase family protein [Cohnella faecalis]